MLCSYKIIFVLFVYLEFLLFVVVVSSSFGSLSYSVCFCFLFAVAKLHLQFAADSIRREKLQPEVGTCGRALLYSFKAVY